MHHLHVPLCNSSDIYRAKYCQVNPMSPALIVEQIPYQLYFCNTSLLWVTATFCDKMFTRSQNRQGNKIRFKVGFNVRYHFSKQSSSSQNNFTPMNSFDKLGTQLCKGLQHIDAFIKFVQIFTTGFK